MKKILLILIYIIKYIYVILCCIGFVVFLFLIILLNAFLMPIDEVKFEVERMNKYLVKIIEL